MNSTEGEVLDAEGDSPEKVATLRFDEDGDVILVLSSDAGTARFQVNSAILCLASPVFRAMLGANSKFKEQAALAARTATSEPLEISLGDDNPEALAVILSIIHLEYDWVPKSLDEDQFYMITVLCDKYDMVQSLKVWLEKWISPLIANLGKSSKEDSRVFIAYVCGRWDLFMRSTKELILHCRMDQNGNLQMANGNPLDEHIPEYILAEISATRQQAMDSISDCVRQRVESYIDPSNPACGRGTRSCDMFALGFMMRTFKELQIYPDASKLTDQSVYAVKKQIDGIKFPDDVVISTVSCDCGLIMTRDHFCISCKSRASKKYQATCSPISGLRKQVEVLFRGIGGLDYDNIVPAKVSNGKKRATSPPDGANLWQRLEYK